MFCLSLYVIFHLVPICVGSGPIFPFSVAFTLRLSILSNKKLVVTQLLILHKFTHSNEISPNSYFSRVIKVIDFKLFIIQSAMEDHPHLTLETALKMMEEFGF